MTILTWAQFEDHSEQDKVMISLSSVMLNTEIKWNVVFCSSMSSLGQSAALLTRLQPGMERAHRGWVKASR